MTKQGPECYWVKENLSAFLDGECSGKDRERVKVHLGECPSCAKEKEALEKAWECLSLLPEANPGAAFDKALFERLGREEGPPPGRGFIRFVASKIFSLKFAALAASVVVLISLALFYNPEPAVVIPVKTENEIIAVLDVLEDMDLLEAESSADLVDFLYSLDYETCLDEEEG